MSDSSLGEAVLDLRADASNLDKDLDTAQNKTKGWLGGVGDVLKTGLGKAIGFGVADLTLNVIGGIKDSFKGAQEAALGQAQLEAALKSTGGTAGVTADMANELAGGLQEITLFTDDATLAGENMLLTFTNIGKDVFPDATKTMLDMSQALGQDVKTSAIQLGKALNDPVRGVTALRKVGVQFTDDQEKQIKALVDSGKTMEAQKLILAELQKEFGGSAEAAANVQPWTVFNNQIEDIQENIAGALLPTINDLGKQLVAWLTSPEVKAGTAELVAAFKTALPQALDFGKKQLPPLLDFLGKLFGILWDNREAIAAVVGVLGALSVIGTVVGWVGGLVGILTTLGGVVSAAVPIIGAVIAILGGPLTLVIAAIIAAIALLVTAWVNDWGGIQEKTQAVAQFISELVQSFLAGIQQFWMDHGEQIMTIVQGYWTMIQGIFETAWALIRGIVTIALDLLRGDFDAAGRDWQTMMQNKMQEIRANIETTWNGITAWLGGLPGTMLTLGFNIVQGIIDGINQQAGAVQGALQGIIDAAIANIKAFLGISSPSELMRAQVGAQMAAGVRLGFENGIGSLDRAFNVMGRGGFAFAGESAPRGVTTLRPNIRITIGNREIRDFVVDTADEEITRVLSKG